MQTLKSYLKFSIHRTGFVFSILLCTIGCDQATKIVARDTLSFTGPLRYLNDMVRLELAQNRGAYLSMGAHLPEARRFWIFTVGPAVGLSVLFYFLLRDRAAKPLNLLALTLILAGGVGNLIDRFLRGSVTDFLIVGIGQISTGIFNVADVAIVAGTLLLLAAHLSSRPGRVHRE